LRQQLVLRLQQRRRLLALLLRLPVLLRLPFRLLPFLLRLS
jgi:hypothetical protein